MVMQKKEKMFLSYFVLNHVKLCNYIFCFSVVLPTIVETYTAYKDCEVDLIVNRLEQFIM